MPYLNQLTGPLASLAGGGFDWFRDAGSTGAADVDFLFYVILWICIFFFVGIVGLMIAFVARYYARPGHSAEHTPHHDNRLEAAWSIVPALITVYIFGAGFIGYLDLRTPPDNSYEIKVYAKKWNFAFEYPNGVIDSNLHVPEDRPVKLILSSDDVIHSLYIPAFRVKCDCVPGRYSSLWFEATDPTPNFDPAIEAKDTGEDENGYDLFCTEYCGQGHSSMIAKVIVHESGTFEQWLEDANRYDETESPAERGRALWKDRGCSQCHSIDGKSGTGPTWKGTYGTEQKTDKGMVKVDENYLRESILNPMAKIRDGYKGVMPSYQGQLKEKEIAAIIWFQKSLKEGVDVPETWVDAGGVPGQGDTAADGEDASVEPAQEETKSEEAKTEAEPQPATAA